MDILLTLSIFKNGKIYTWRYKILIECSFINSLNFYKESIFDFVWKCSILKVAIQWLYPQLLYIHVIIAVYKNSYLHFTPSLPIEDNCPSMYLSRTFLYWQTAANKIFQRTNPLWLHFQINCSKSTMSLQ